MEINEKSIHDALLRLGCTHDDLKKEGWDSIKVAPDAMSRLLGYKVGQTVVEHYGHATFLLGFGWEQKQTFNHVWLTASGTIVIRVECDENVTELYRAVSDFIVKKLAPELQPAWRRWFRRKLAEFKNAYSLPKPASQ